MNIDERLERLTERHEALTQSVEILRVTVEEQTKRAEEQTKQIELLLATARQDGDNIRALARVADMHDRRLTELERGGRR